MIIDESFYKEDCLYPIGYSAARILTNPDTKKREQHSFVIHSRSKITHNGTSHQDFSELIPILKRNDSNCIQTVETMFGLGHDTYSAFLELYESLPRVEYCKDYETLFGKNNHYDLRLACNPSGCGRTEWWRKKVIKQNPRKRQISGKMKSKQEQKGETLQELMRETGMLNAQEIAQSLGLESACDGAALIQEMSGKGVGFRQTNKHWLYKKMQQEWRLNTQLNRSRIQGLGLYAKRDLEAGIMVIEYCGMLIRPDLAESRELAYDKVGKGTYMFR